MVPGWHTTIFSPYLIYGVIITIVLLFVIIGYWLLAKHTNKTNWALFTFHVALTIPTLIYLKFPLLFLNLHPDDSNEVLQAISYRVKIIPIVWTLFIAGQMLFPIYYIRTIRAKGKLIKGTNK